MNEASSKFVDTLAMEKLISEKVIKVNHSPLNSYFKEIDADFNCITKYFVNISRVKKFTNDKNLSGFLVPSFLDSSPYIGNNSIYLYYFPAKLPEGNILLVHGLFDDNIDNYNFLIKLLNEQGFNVFFMVLPFHYDRKPYESLYGGEYFFSADFYRLRYAFKQAVFDIEASIQFITAHNKLPVILAGFSMGGGIASRYYLLKKQAVDLFLINPITNLMSLPWDNPLLLTVGQAIEDSGFDSTMYNDIIRELDTCENIYAYFGDNVSMIYSIYDQIIEEQKYDKFIKKTGIKNVSAYSAGHLNILRVPKLSKEIRDFFKKQKGSYKLI